MAKKRPSRKRTPPKAATKETTSSVEELVKAEVERQIPKVETGLAVAMPNTVDEKMAAICHLSNAVQELARALASTNVHVRIEDCHFQNTGMQIT